MNTYNAVLQKMTTIFSNPISYYLDLEENQLLLNEYLGKKICILHTGYQCLSCLKDKEIYRQGFCKKCFFENPAAGDWIMHPELSKAHLDIEDRDLEYEKSVQLQPHIVYLANSSSVKVGVTRKTQVPTRWIDQGAHIAMLLCEVPNRYLAGITEVALKKYIADKTNWRKMLTNSITEVNLLEMKYLLKQYIPQEALPYFLEEVQETQIVFPVIKYPTKVNSLNLQKTPSYEGILQGIKGQYLIFEDNTVFNIRSHEGFRVEISL